MAECSCYSHGGFILGPGSSGPAQQLSLEGLAPRGVIGYLDKSGSVSALVEGEGDTHFDDALIEEQYRRFINGS